MGTKSKALLVALCAALLAVTSVFGTLAYLTDQEAVANTFTVGSVGLTLDEAEVNADGTIKSDKRVQENSYHLLPGSTYIKDPTVTVEEGSEDAYIRMMVKVEGLDQLKLAMPAEDFPVYYSGDVFLLQMLCMDDYGPGAACTWNSDAWKFETFHSSDAYENCYEFRYKTTANGKSGPGVLEPLFTHITVPGEIDSDHMPYLEKVQILVSAHAMQAAGFEDDEAGAWAAFSK